VSVGRLGRFLDGPVTAGGRSAVSSAWVGVALVAVLLAGCATTTPTDATRGTTGHPVARPASTTTAPPLPVTPVQWTPCGTLQCGSVTVPLDYHQPQGATLQLAVARHPAETPLSRIGSVVINPGGPGGSGIDDLPTELSVLTPELLDRFDIVSFDPRGVGRSSPVTCAAASTSGSGGASPSPLLDPAPTTPVAQQALLANDRAFAAQCVRDSGALLAHLGTVDAARDLDRIRQALGDPQLTFIGHSYGTLLGAIYAEEFPTHVRAMVLDGAIDPALTTTRYATDQADSLETQLSAFFAWCASDAGCPWRPVGDPTAAVLALIDHSLTVPLTVPGGTVAGPGELYDALLAGLESRSSWPTLAGALAQAETGAGAAVATMSGRYETGESSNAATAEEAIDCVDHPVDRDPTVFPALAAAAGRSAPVFGPLLVWGLLGCATWPVPPTRAPAPASDPGAPPILVVGTTGDPVTPYAWAVALAQELTGATLLTWEGQSHVATFYSACVRGAIQSYLVGGILPAEGTVCTD
jgi:pimeloyl-ACP methyl ester carboxylesterase